MSDAARPPAALERTLGVRAQAALIFNTVVGSGIFVLPAIVAAALGPAAILAYVAAAVIIGLVTLCFAECGSRVTASGGPFAYIEAAFGRLPGSIAGVLLYLAIVGGSAAVAHVLLGAIAGLWEPAGRPDVRAALLAVLYGGLAALNVRGVRPGARLVELMTVAKLLPLVGLAAAGVWYVRLENFTGFAWPGVGAIATTTLGLVFAFAGTESALTPSGEVRDPARTVPRAIALALLAVVALYGALQFVAQGVLGAALATEQAAPLAATARAIAGAPGGLVVLVAALVSTCGYLTGDVLAAPRVLYGLSRDGTLPAALGVVHPRWHTPWVAVLAHAGLAWTLAVAGAFAALAVLSVLASLVLYVGCAAAVLELRRRDVRAGGTPFRIPGGPLVPLLAIAASLWLVSSATWAQLRVVLLVIALTIARYAIGRLRQHARARHAALAARVPGRE